ncbi:MAG: DNA methyltransferase [Candidatus Latescibacter sp.]|nr:DNA methyltransferase [Candidatus Latescibacter sp.]
MTPWKNKLYYGDNLRIMREYLDDESVDLIYLDPPFNSKATYNVLFREKNGSDSSAQITAFDDTWHWDAAAAETYHDLVTRGPQKLAALMDAFHSFLGQNDMIAYLAMMAARLVEMRRVLKPTGSIYLHCDPTASHYLKIVLDSIFGGENYKNEIIWQRINAKGNVQRKFGAVHDVILLYAKILGKEQWNQVYRPLDQSYIDKTYRFIEEGTGRKYSLDNLTASMQRASTGQIYEWKGKRPPATRCWVYAVDRMEELDRQGRIIYSKNGYPRFNPDYS